MKSGYFFVVLLLAVACLGLTVAQILMEHTNQKLQVQLQVRQQALNQGILGQQAQQISGGVLKDLVNAAAGSPEIRQLLEKHGYRVSPASSGSALNAPAIKQAETTNPEAVKP